MLATGNVDSPGVDNDVTLMTLERSRVLLRVADSGERRGHTLDRSPAPMTALHRGYV
ncbi:Hypothetical protein SMAX5B_012994 [Scophthalmus maximus]|uniref:Uncharacterized protein n=1 Tax=Scophthalmus maximus TaxID=52904 RepID=A0A2U9BMX3_SCOMX|nr:Hypothetical protein SMAX5B_012994 [Scophthalmus maximus]